MPDITLNITTKDLSSDELERLRRDIKRIKEAVSRLLSAISGQPSDYADSVGATFGRDINDSRQPIADSLKAVSRQQSGVSDQSSNISSHALSIIQKMSVPVSRKPIADSRLLAAESQKAVSSVREKVTAIEQIQRTAGERQKAIETEVNQAKIASFNRVVQNFVRGIDQMIAAQLKLRVVDGIGGLKQAILPFLSAAPLPVLSTVAAALFSGSFDGPINDVLAQQAGMRQAQQRGTQLGRKSAIDLTRPPSQNVETGFVRETERQTVVSSPPQEAAPAPVVMNEVKLIIGGQEIKALYEETQRQIATGIIAEAR